MQGGSYTLTIYYGGQFKTIEEESRVYVGKKAVKQGWAVGFSYADLITMLGAEFGYEERDDIFITPPYTKSEYAMIRVMNDEDLAFLIGQLGGIRTIVLFVVKCGEEFDDWFGDQTCDEELSIQNVDGESDEEEGEVQVDEDGDIQVDEADEEGEEQTDEEESDGVSSFGAEENDESGPQNVEGINVEAQNVEGENEQTEAPPLTVEEYAALVAELGADDEPGYGSEDLDGPPVEGGAARRSAEYRPENGVQDEAENVEGINVEAQNVDGENEQTEAPPLTAEEYAALVAELGADDERGYGSEDLDGPPVEGGAARRGSEYRPENGVQEPEEKMTYASVNTFRRAIQDWSIFNKYAIVWKRNDSHRSVLRCRKEGCDWKLTARQIKGEPTFRIAKIVGEHTCSRSQESVAMTVDWLVDKLLPKLRAQADLTESFLMDEIKRAYKMKVSFWKIRRAKRKALTKINGENTKQFERLRDYGHEVVKKNPGSTVVIKSQLIGPSPRPTFERFYVSYAAMHRGFKRGCRPFIALDGCHLKGLEGGQLLNAVTRDANNNLFPIACAWVEAETKESWKWFLEHLNGDLDQNTRFTFMSDRQKGLMPAIEEVFPGSECRSCVRHIYQNMVAQKWKGPLIRDKVWGAASAHTLHLHEYFMEELKKIHYQAWEYLTAIPANTWARCHFSTHSKCDLLVNNISECWNSKILKCRGMPIVSLFEWIRWELMTEFQQKREKMGKFRDIICPRIKKKLEKIASTVVDNIYGHAGPGVYEVKHCSGSCYTVELEKKTCSCGAWQMSGIPCSHAYGAITNDREAIEKYVDPCYFKEAYLKAYADIIYPLSGPEEWTRLNCPLLLPPVWRRSSGRPKKKRQRSADEPNPHNAKRRRTDLPQHCSKCKQIGHNARGCGKERRVRKRTTTESTQGPSELPVQPTQSTQGPSELPVQPTQSTQGPSELPVQPTQSSQGPAQVSQGQPSRAAARSARTDKLPVRRSALAASKPSAAAAAGPSTVIAGPSTAAAGPSRSGKMFKTLASKTKKGSKAQKAKN